MKSVNVMDESRVSTAGLYQDCAASSHFISVAYLLLCFVINKDYSSTVLVAKLLMKMHVFCLEI